MYNKRKKLSLAFGKRKVVTVKSRTTKHFHQTNISRELLSRKIVCEVRRTKKCSLISTFAFAFIVCKILLPSKVITFNILSIS